MSPRRDRKRGPSRDRNTQGERALKRPEYTGRESPRKDRNVQGEWVLGETRIHMERGPLERPEYTGREGQR